MKNLYISPTFEHEKGKRSRLDPRR